MQNAVLAFYFQTIVNVHKHDLCFKADFGMHFSFTYDCKAAAQIGFVSSMLKTQNNANIKLRIDKGL